VVSMRTHTDYMQHALRLAATHTGCTGSNPAVGCVVVNHDQIVGTGISARGGGRPHAETQALAMAGDAARGATVYVTLEPCSHTGQTGPCADALIAAGVAQVICALRDPDPRVNGRGIARLQEAGIVVVENIETQAALRQMEGFVRHRTQHRPFISLKLATTMDGYLANAAGVSQWITGEDARQFGHLLRSRHDAILTGSGTWFADHPHLNCRLPGLEDASPKRYIADRRRRIAQTEEVTLLHDYKSIADMVGQLANEGVTRLLVEAGGKLTTAFLASGLVDELYWFQAPIWFGKGALPALQDFPLQSPAELARATRLATHHFHHDICQHLRLTEYPCLPASSQT